MNTEEIRPKRLTRTEEVFFKIRIATLIITASDIRPRQQGASIGGGCVVLVVPLGFGMAGCDVF